MRPSDAPTLILEFTPAMRVLIEDAIEALILLLDEIDGDADLEDEPDDEDGADREPSLGANNSMAQDAWGRSGMDDREFEDEREPENWL